MSDSIVFVSARRTAIGSFQGQFAAVKAPQLGSAAIRAVMADAGISGDDVSEVIMGCVLPAGTGGAGAPGRAWCRPADQRGCDHHQQGLRFRHESGDAGQ